MIVTLTSTVNKLSSTWWHRARRLVALWYFSRIFPAPRGEGWGAILSIERTLYRSRLRISNCIKADTPNSKGVGGSTENEEEAEGASANARDWFKCGAANWTAHDRTVGNKPEVRKRTRGKESWDRAGLTASLIGTTKYQEP